MKFKSIDTQCRLAFEASSHLAVASSAIRQAALEKMAVALRTHQKPILEANSRDIERGIQAGLSSALIDRLTLNSDRLHAMADSVAMIAGLPDPLGEVLGGWVRPNGLKISKIRVPLGVIAMIYEARPNVTADAIALGIKTGNAMVLRGSSSASESNKAILDVLHACLVEAGLHPDSIQLLTDMSHEGVTHLVSLRQYISVAIPRGGHNLIQNVVTHAQVPTIETGVGNCHIFVDESADLDGALAIIENAKVQRPSVCNSCETVLVHSRIAQTFIPRLSAHLKTFHVELRGCTTTQTFISCTPAQNSDWDTEFLDLILAVKVVDDVHHAITHIRTHGTRHSESILSNTLSHIERFKSEVDAAAVLVNASTRFVDGGEFGFGAELGISTQKLHARGPMGLPELTTYKYIVEGSGQIRS